MLAKQGRNRIRDVMLICTSLVIYPSSSSARSFEEKSMQQSAAEVLAIIKNGNLNDLYNYVQNPISFDDNGHMIKEVKCYFKKNISCKTYSNLDNISNQEIFIDYDRFEKNRVIVNYVKSKKAKIFSNKRDIFLENRYMIDYFSCEFVLIENRWFLKESICFAETEGPYEQEAEI